MKTANEIHPVDIQVGENVRKRRRALGLSQGELASAVAVSFQQIQKYENGKNRVSASKLYEIARVLKVSIEYFFNSDETPAIVGRDEAETKEFEALLAAFGSIERKECRRSILALTRCLADASRQA